MRTDAPIWMLKALLLLLCFSQTALAEPFETIINNGVPGNRVDIAILGDGYTAGEQQKYKDDVQALIQRFFDEQPFKDYRYFFNVHRIDVISSQSGADHPERTPPLTVNTAFDATYNCFGIQRLICVDSSKVNLVLSNTLTPSQHDITLVVVNDFEYGGSGGAIAVASTHSAVVELVLHELGHSFGLLTDEYGGPPPPSCNNNVEPFAVNATRTTERSSIKWNHWIDPNTPIPTLSTTSGVPGLFEGAAYCDNGLYRPTFDSKMRFLGRPYEQINNEQLIKRIYNIVSPIDSSLPTAADLTITRGQLQPFQISPVSTPSNTIRVDWYLNGQLQSTGTEFTVNSGNLNTGSYVIDAVVKDNTQLVRRDDENLLSENRSWNLIVNSESSTVQFGSASYTVGEGGNSATVNVVRNGNASAAATLDYATSDSAGLTNCNVVNGNASSRCDYATSVGRLSFAAGETSKTISIPIVDDAYAEGNESFTISLSNATGVTVGTPGSATVTINDNETVNGTNPIDQTPFFVRQQYVDFLGREPDPGGFAAWQNVINNCPAGSTDCDRIHVSSAFFRSAEFQGRGYFIYRFYPVAFGRKPDYVEFIPDLAKVSGFLSDAELEAAKVTFVAEFMTRPAFVTKFNALTDTQYVDTLLATAQVTSQHRDFWIAALGNGTRTRATVLRDITESPEVYNKYYNQAFVVMQYFGYLRRDPDALYLDWIQVLDTTGDFRGMVNGFMNSTEYRFRFGP